MITLSKHTKFREEEEDVFLCQCKDMVDFRVEHKYLELLKKLSAYVEETELSAEEKEFVAELRKARMLSDICLRTISEQEFDKADELLVKYLYTKKRPRSYDFLKDQFRQFPQFFIGLFVGDELVGVIQGFPREDYLLISEIALKPQFRNKGFGRLLLIEFERRAKTEKYQKICVGAEDKAIGFYKKAGYKPFLMAQIEKNIGKSKPTLSKYQLIKKYVDNNYDIYELVAEQDTIEYLEEAKKDFKTPHCQFIFYKIM